mmetsp:Transcript_4205/g.11883  ORF Transcript_4205/g.11883 Transcript_4205/m.11883 type:complete len:243 (+) Transcript_4205:691-1419(+)
MRVLGPTHETLNFFFTLLHKVVSRTSSVVRVWVLGPGNEIVDVIQAQPSRPLAPAFVPLLPAFLALALALRCFVPIVIVGLPLLALSFVLPRLLVLLVLRYIVAASLAFLSFPFPLALATFSSATATSRLRKLLGPELTHERLVDGRLVAFIRSVERVLRQFDLYERDAANVRHLVETLLQWLIFIHHLGGTQGRDLVKSFEATLHNLSQRNRFGQCIASGGDGNEWFLQFGEHRGGTCHIS